MIWYICIHCVRTYVGYAGLTVDSDTDIDYIHKHLRSTS